MMNGSNNVNGNPPNGNPPNGIHRPIDDERFAPPAARMNGRANFVVYIHPANGNHDHGNHINGNHPYVNGHSHSCRRFQNENVNANGNNPVADASASREAEPASREVETASRQAENAGGNSDSIPSEVEKANAMETSSEPQAEEEITSSCSELSDVMEDATPNESFVEKETPEDTEVTDKVPDMEMKEIGDETPKETYHPTTPVIISECGEGPSAMDTTPYEPFVEKETPEDTKATDKVPDIRIKMEEIGDETPKETYHPTTPVIISECGEPISMVHSLMPSTVLEALSKRTPRVDPPPVPMDTDSSMNVPVPPPSPSTSTSPLKDKESPMNNPSPSETSPLKDTESSINVPAPSESSPLRDRNIPNLSASASFQPSPLKALASIQLIQSRENIPSSPNSTLEHNAQSSPNPRLEQEISGTDQFSESAMETDSSVNTSNMSDFAPPKPSNLNSSKIKSLTRSCEDISISPKHESRWESQKGSPHLEKMLEDVVLTEDGREDLRRRWSQSIHGGENAEEQQMPLPSDWSAETDQKKGKAEPIPECKSKRNVIHMESNMSNHRHSPLERVLTRATGYLIDKIREETLQLVNDPDTRAFIPLALSPLVDNGLFHIVFPDAKGPPYFYLIPFETEDGQKQEIADDELAEIGNAEYLPSELEKMGTLVIPPDYSEESYVNKIGGYPLPIQPGSDIVIDASEMLRPSEIRRKNPQLSGLLGFDKAPPKVLMDNPILTSIVSERSGPTWRGLLNLVGRIYEERERTLRHIRKFLLLQSLRTLESSVVEEWIELDKNYKVNFHNKSLAEKRQHLIEDVYQSLKKNYPPMAHYWKEFDASRELLLFDYYTSYKDVSRYPVPRKPVEVTVYTTSIDVPNNSKTEKTDDQQQKPEGEENPGNPVEIEQQVTGESGAIDIAQRTEEGTTGDMAMQTEESVAGDNIMRTEEGTTGDMAMRTEESAAGNVMRTEEGTPEDMAMRTEVSTAIDNIMRTVEGTTGKMAMRTEESAAETNITEREAIEEITQQAQLAEPANENIPEIPLQQAEDQQFKIPQQPAAVPTQVSRLDTSV